MSYCVSQHYILYKKAEGPKILVKVMTCFHYKLICLFESFIMKGRVRILMDPSTVEHSI